MHDSVVCCIYIGNGSLLFYKLGDIPCISNRANLQVQTALTAVTDVIKESA